MSAFTRDRVEISEAVRAIGVPPQLARVLDLGSTGNVGVSRDRVEISEAVRAIGVPPQSARVLDLGFIGNVGVSQDRIQQREAVRAMETTFFNQRYLNCVGARIARPPRVLN